MDFYCYPKCSTCQKAKKWLDDNRIAYREINIKTDHPDAETIRELVRKSGLPLKRFFNTSGMLYRSMQLSERLPKTTEEEQITLLSSDGMLVKRPILAGDSFALVGFRQQDWEKRLINS